MIEPIDAAVRWYLEYMNTPELLLLFPASTDITDRWAAPYDSDALRWHHFDRVIPCKACKGTGTVAERHQGVLAKAGEVCDRCDPETHTEVNGVMHICRQAPVVKFVYESSFGGGAMTTHGIGVDGKEFRTKGGWSSNAGQINGLRTTDPRYAEVLPEPIVEAVYKRGTWDQLGMAGVCFDLTWTQEQVERFLPGVELVTMEAASDIMASSEQSLVVGGDTGRYYIPRPVEADMRVRRGDPELTARGKPNKDTGLYAATSEEVKMSNARTQTRRVVR